MTVMMTGNGRSGAKIDVQDGEVTLTGTVSDRQAKRAAEGIAETVAGVRDVHNRLQLQHYSFRRQP